MTWSTLLATISNYGSLSLNDLVLNLKKDIAELSQFSRNRLFADVNLSGFFGGVQGPDRRIELCAGLLPGWGRLFLERL